MTTSLSSISSLSSLHRRNNVVTRLRPSSLRLYLKLFTVRSQSAPVLTQDDLKKLAADKAVDYVKSGMVLDLGTGSTASFVVSKLGELLKSGELIDIVGIPTSKRTDEQARSLGIPISILDHYPHLDLAIDDHRLDPSFLFKSPPPMA